uniref:Uncharacterized protein n=1 Tax=Arundo donax TaxID=35708 RepID=A0A0A9HQV3_ARUDO
MARAPPMNSTVGEERDGCSSVRESYERAAVCE